MKVLAYPDWETLEISQAPVPEIAPDEVLLRVAACGVCGSELESFKNRSPRRPPPLVMGHEFCGTIEQIGARVEGHEVGQSVVSNSLVPCGSCVRCARGDGHLCAQRQIFGMHRGGAFAQWVNVPARVLTPWPQSLPAQIACLAEPLANGVHMVGLTRHLKIETVLVIGAGPIGLMAGQAFQALTGAQVWAADLSEERLDAARRCGASEVFNPRARDLVAEMRARTGGEGADLVIDAVGAAQTKTQSLEAARPGGAAVWIGLHQNEMALSSYDITLPEKQVLGTYAATLDELRAAVNLLEQGRVEVASWVQPFALEEGREAFARMLAARGADIKAVIVPELS